VCDVDRGDAQLPLQPLQLSPHVDPKLRITEGLIHEEELGLLCQRPGEGDALLLATAQLCRLTVKKVFDA